MGTTSDLPNRGTLKTKKEANKDKNGIKVTLVQPTCNPSLFMLTYT